MQRSGTCQKQPPDQTTADRQHASPPIIECASTTYLKIHAWPRGPGQDCLQLNLWCFQVSALAIDAHVILEAFKLKVTASVGSVHILACAVCAACLEDTMQFPCIAIRSSILPDNMLQQNTCTDQ